MASAAFTPSTSVAPSLVAVVTDGAVWLWDDRSVKGRVAQLTDAVDAWPSPDGSHVLVLRELAAAPGQPSDYGQQALWLLDAVTGESREIVTNAELQADLDLLNAANPGYDTSIPRPHGIGWIPGTSTFTWQVSPVMVSGLGGPMPDLVYAFDLATQAKGALPFRNEFGTLLWSPNGQWVAATAGPSLRLIRASDGVSVETPQLGPRIGRGHYNMMLAAEWLPDSSSVVVAAAQSDAPSEAGTLQSVPYDVYEVAVPDAQVTKRGSFSALLREDLAFSPDGVSIAVYQDSDPTPMAGSRLPHTFAEIVGLADGEHWPLPAGSVFVAWSPDSTRYLYSADQSLYVGRFGNPGAEIGGLWDTGGRPQAVWLDSERIAYLARRDQPADSGDHTCVIRVGTPPDGMVDEGFATDCSDATLRGN